MSSETEQSFEIEGTVRAKGTWTMRLGEEWLELDPPGERKTERIARADIRKKTRSLDGGALLFAQIPDESGFQLDPEAAAAFLDWRGPLTEQDLKTALRQNTVWLLVIAAMFVFGSLPVVGDPAAGIDPLPFSPLNLGLGLALVLHVVLVRLRPAVWLLLFEFGWFVLAAANIALDVYRGDSYFWLISVAFILAISWARWQEYAKFRREYALP